MRRLPSVLLMGAATDEALVDAAIDGDEQAWEVICEQHLPQVRTVAHARLRDAHAAEDVVQETFLRAWTRLPQVRDATRLGSWLKTIAAHVAVDHVRRQRATAPLDGVRDTPAPGPSHDEVVVAREEAELGMTSGAVRVLLSRARQCVRDGYGVFTAPVVGLLTRWRNRLAGLGDAVPVALAAPAVVVAVVAVVGLPAQEPAAPVMPDTSVYVAPATPEPVTPATGTQAVTALPSTEADLRPPSPAPPAGGSTTTSTTAPPRPAPGVDLGSESAGFGDEAPTDDEADAEAPAPSGPVEGIEIYLEDTGLGELDQDCPLCG